jgi:DNA polymerase I-like protein with 3'-5' exonuclease and polymerase domains
MRLDSSGLWWTDATKQIRGSKDKMVVNNRPLPAIPDTGWSAPREFPRLDSYKGLIAVDTETYDPNLTTTGPSTRTGGEMVGISVATNDQQWYFPMRHRVGANLDPDHVIEWAKDALSGSQDKVGHNFLYDLEWLWTDGIALGGRLLDTSYAGPLLDEEARSYSLNAMGNRYVGEHKEEDTLYQWLAKAYGGAAERKQAGNIYRAPPELVGPYAEQDARLTWDLAQKVVPLLEAEELLDLWHLECRLLKPLLYLRQKGVPVDVEKAKRIDDWLTSQVNDASKLLNGIDLYAADSIASFCKKQGIEYPATATGRPSFTEQWLSRHEHPAMKAITQARKYTKARDTFVRGYILDKQVGGHIYGQFHPLRSDESGTVSGRFSSSGPNLQNIPNRDPEIGPMIRSLFVPLADHDWTRFDWSQIEFRMLAHFGLGDGAEDVRRLYREQPDVDFHQMCAELTGVGRKQAKNINFGLVYGMGIRKMAADLGLSVEEAEPLFTEYHSRLPFVKNTYHTATQTASKRGYVKTLLNRRRRFNLWDGKGKDDKGLTIEQAMDKGLPKFQLRRAFTNKALNAVLQGSAADLMKLAMVQIWDAGLMNDDNVMHLTVHDELDWSTQAGPAGQEHAAEVKRIMESVYPIRVPIIADMEVGPSWGEVK